MPKRLESLSALATIVAALLTGLGLWQAAVVYREGQRINEAKMMTELQDRFMQLNVEATSEADSPKNIQRHARQAATILAMHDLDGRIGQRDYTDVIVDLSVHCRAGWGKLHADGLLPTAFTREVLQARVWQRWIDREEDDDPAISQLAPPGPNAPPPQPGKKK